MSHSAKVQYFLTVLGFSFLYIALLYSLFFLPGNEFLFARLFYPTSATCLIASLAALWTNFILVRKLHFPSYETLLALLEESRKQDAFTPSSDNLALHPYLTDLAQGSSPQRIAIYKKFLPFCAFMANPGTQRGFQSLVLIVGLGILEVMGYGGLFAVPALCILVIFALCRILKGVMDLL